MTTDKTCNIEWRKIIDPFVLGEAPGIQELGNAVLHDVDEKQILMEEILVEQVSYVRESTLP